VDTRDEERRYKQAKARVEALKGFYIHFAFYLMVNAGLFLINAITASNWWFYWPLLGWGIGLTAHALAVFVIGDALGPGWEERKIRQYLGETARGDTPPQHPTQAT
jgi:2TM domain